MAGTRPVAYYNMETATGTELVDRSDAGNDLDGTLAWNDMWDDSTKAAGTYSLEYNGNTDKVTISKSALTDFDHDDAFSFSIWCKIPSFSGWKILFGNDEGGVAPAAYQGYLIAVYNNIVYWMLQNTWNTDTKQIGIYGETSVGTGSWVHVVCTYNGNGANSGLKIYVNGSEDEPGAGYSAYPPAASTLTSTIIATTDLRIGEGFGTGYHWTTGWVDELSIWDIELSAAQVATLYDGGTPLNCACGIDGAPPVAISKLSNVSSCKVKKANGVSAIDIGKLTGVG